MYGLLFLINMTNETTYNPEFTYVLPAVRKDGVTFVQCAMAAVEKTELVKEFDRLCGCNLSRRGAPINIMIDDATGKFDEDMKKFLQFVWDSVFTRMPLTDEK